MKTIEILEREHEWIGWMDECLEALVASAQAEDLLPEAAYELLSLYESFADGRHQDKEEGVLFPELLAAASDQDCEVLRKLLSDHGAERRHMVAMRGNVLGAVHGQSANVQGFVREASAYLSLHRGHMLRESEILLPMVARLLMPGADERAAEGFAAVEGGPGDPHGLREQILTLHRRAGLPRPPAA